MCVCMHMYVCMCAHVYVCVCLRMHMCVYVHACVCLCYSLRCREDGRGEEQRALDKCPFMDTSGSEEDISGILQYMATLLGQYHVCVFVCVCACVCVGSRVLAWVSTQE